MNPEEIVRHWVESVERTAPESFRRVRDFASIPNPPAGDSLAWCRQMFAFAASPHWPLNQVQHAFHLAEVDPGPAFDLLRHEYQTASSELVVTEGINFVLIRARPATGTARPRVDEVAHTVLNLLEEEKNPAEKRGPLYRFPEPRAENLIVSTNPQENPASTARWTDRIDALLRAGSVYLLCYKKRPATMGFRDDAQWFAEDFRENPVLTE